MQSDENRKWKTVAFALGTRQFETSGYEADEWHYNVNLLSLPRTLLNRTLWAILPLVPDTIYRWLKQRWPEWVLPEHIVLKHHKGEDWEQEFDDEIANYRRLEPLQGKRIPEYFGETQYFGMRAIIISRVFGQKIFAYDDWNRDGSISPFSRGEPEMYLYLRDAYEEIGKLGLVHEDPLLANFLLVEDSKGRHIVVLDLERMWEYGSDHPNKDWMISINCLDVVERARQRRFGDEVPQHLEWRTLYSKSKIDYLREKRERAADPNLEAAYQDRVRDFIEEDMRRMRARKREEEEEVEEEAKEACPTGANVDTDRNKKEQ